jgi:hypothetical protein
VANGSVASGSVANGGRSRRRRRPFMYFLCTKGDV